MARKIYLLVNAHLISTGSYKNAMIFTSIFVNIISNNDNKTLVLSSSSMTLYVLKIKELYQTYIPKIFFSKVKNNLILITIIKNN